MTRTFQRALVRPLGIRTRSDMTSGLITATTMSALNRETPTKETHKMVELHVEGRLKWLWVRIGEALKLLGPTNAGRWWPAWVSGGREWVLGSSKATNAVCLVVLNLGTNSALSRQPEPGKKHYMQLYWPPRCHHLGPFSQFSKNKSTKKAY